MIHRIMAAVLLACFFVFPGHAQVDGDTPRVTIHVVQRGENLFRIAMSYGLTTDEVALANGIIDPSSILVGQRLIIPVEGMPLAEDVPQVHVIQPGESLATIAQAYGVTPENLAAINRMGLTDAIYVGQELLLVDASAAPEDAGIEEVPASTNNITHVVQAGQTLFSIAQQYGTTIAELQTLNNIANATRIFAGQELVIPGIQAPRPALDLPNIINDMVIDPLFITEGKSAKLRIVTGLSVEVSGSFLDRGLRVFSSDDGTQHNILIGVPIYTEPGVYPLQLTLRTGGPPVETTVNVQITPGGYGQQSISLPEDKVSLLSPAVEDNEFNILAGLTSQINPERYFDGPFSLPAAAVMNSPFGVRRSYNGGAVDRFHSGVDFMGAPGTLILAAAPGRVVLVDILHIRGRTVMIDHGWGVYTLYAHLQDQQVALGDFVNTGDVIGGMGNTGRSTGVHLHWELWVNGTVVDPLQWVRQSFS